jgi:hypothetical protein
VADTSKTASATVTINSGATVTVSPSSITINAGDRYQFTDTVTNVVSNSTTSTAVNWNVSDVQGGNSTTGTISQTGLYFAPQTIGSQQTFVVKAVLQADSNSFGTANVSFPPMRRIYPQSTQRRCLKDRRLRTSTSPEAIS